MNIGMLVLCGTLGSLFGAVCNNWLALKIGRPFFEKYGRHLLVSVRSLEKADRFFKRHGPVGTFIGGLLPGIRQYISLPAGPARMNFFAFRAATVLESAIWVLVLAVLGYWFGRNEQLVLRNLRWVTLALVAACIIVAILYWRRCKNRLPPARQ
jgi:membrane protein DedA with SNARE-associated domain